MSHPSSTSDTSSYYHLPSNDPQLWKRIQKELSNPIPDPTSLIRVIQRFKQYNIYGTEWIEPTPLPEPGPDDSPRPFKHPEMVSLVYFFQRFYPPEKQQLFFSSVLPRIQAVALEMMNLFPSGDLPRLKAGAGEDRTVVFTRKQLLCLLVHMFFCTTTKQSVAYWPNYLPWYEFWQSDGIIVYLHTLLEYFTQRVGELEQSDRMGEEISIKRACLSSKQSELLSSLPSNSTPLCSVSICDRIALDDPSSYADCDQILEVDFAHHDISFGRGGTQEELLLGASPETHVLPLILESVQAEESVSISNAQRVGTYRGFGCDVTYTGPFVPPAPSSCESSSSPCSATALASPLRTIIAMDATNMWSLLGELTDEECDLPSTHLRLLKLQCATETRRRDLIKAFVAMDASRQKDSSLPHRRVLWTGSWGCNSFGGNVHVKFILQWMAASLAGIHLLRYQVFTAAADDQFAQDVSGLIGVAQLLPAHATVGLLARCLDEFATSVEKMELDSKSRDVFDTPGIGRQLFDIVRKRVKTEANL